MFEKGDRVRVRHNLKEIDALLRLGGYSTPGICDEMEKYEGQVFTLHGFYSRDSKLCFLEEISWTWHEGYLELAYDNDKIEVSSEEELLDLLS